MMKKPWFVAQPIHKKERQNHHNKRVPLIQKRSKRKEELLDDMFGVHVTAMCHREHNETRNHNFNTRDATEPPDNNYTITTSKNNNKVEYNFRSNM